MRMGIRGRKTVWPLMLWPMKKLAFGFVNPVLGFPGGSDGKESACNTRDLGSIPGSGRFLEKEMAIHSSILACKIPWTEEPGGL